MKLVSIGLFVLTRLAPEVSSVSGKAAGKVPSTET